MGVRGMKVGGLRHNIGVVFQEVLLLNRSVADNLRVGKADATLEEMRAAAARAQALDFIEALPDGFGTAGAEPAPALSPGGPHPVSHAPPAAQATPTPPLSY